MLYEISHLRQSNRSLIKRWFTDQNMDLFVWFRDQVPVRFQLCFNKQEDEKAINWDCHRGFHLYSVDNGENVLDRYKQTPLLLNYYNQQDMAGIARNFLLACEKLDAGITDFIYARLLEFPAAPLKFCATNKDRASHPPNSSPSQRPPAV